MRAAAKLAVGRGLVLCRIVQHAQGAGVAVVLVAEKIDGKPKRNGEGPHQPGVEPLERQVAGLESFNQAGDGLGPDIGLKGEGRLGRDVEGVHPAGRRVRI